VREDLDAYDDPNGPRLRGMRAEFVADGLEKTRLLIRAGAIEPERLKHAIDWVAARERELADAAEAHRLAIAAEREADRAAEVAHRAEEAAHRKARELADTAYQADEAEKSTRMRRLTERTLAVAVATLVAGLLAWLLPRH
jgi:ferric-dicitrate binding protein FerR (iron transport regulator)